MKSFPAILMSIVLVGCAGTSPSPPERADLPPYIAKPLADGSIEILVVRKADITKRPARVQFGLGDALEEAADQECPRGHELVPDKTPTVVRTDSELITTFRGIARCK